MAAPHLALAILFSILAVQSAYDLWAHGGDPMWRSGLHLLVAICAAVVVWREVRRGREAARDPR